MPIDFVAVKPSPARWELFAQQTELNEKIRTWSATQAGLGFLDIVPLMLNEEGKPREELFLKDRLHMNAEGYALWQKYFLEKWN